MDQEKLLHLVKEDCVMRVAFEELVKLEINKSSDVRKIFEDQPPHPPRLCALSHRGDLKAEKRREIPPECL